MRALTQSECINNTGLAVGLRKTVAVLQLDRSRFVFGVFS
jgi:hypothetical protein